MTASLGQLNVVIKRTPPLIKCTIQEILHCPLDLRHRTSIKHHRASLFLLQGVPEGAPAAAGAQRREESPQEEAGEEEEHCPRTGGH